MGPTVHPEIISLTSTALLDFGYLHISGCMSVFLSYTCV